MLRHLLCGQGRFADSASKTHTPSANPRRTLLCHPDNHLKRKERWQAVGLVRIPLKRVGVRLAFACGAGLFTLGNIPPGLSTGAP